jgi:cell division protein FtsW
MKRYHAPDFALAIATIALVGFGLLVLSSASVVESFTATGSNYYYFVRQLIFALVGIGAWLFFQRFSYHKLGKWANTLLYIALGLLVVVLIPGIGYQIGGARRWISLGPVTIQISEVVKLAVIVYLAQWFSKENRFMGNFQRVTLPFIAMLALLGALIMLEPDFGTLGIISLIMLSMYWTAGAAFRHIALIGSMGVATFWFLIKVEPYRLSRLLAFLDPKRDPLGISYHINQALLALGSGGLFGLGLGYSRQKYNYLPAASSDSIFAIMGEELGFIRTMFLILLYGFIIYRGIRIAQKAPDTFSRLLATGITTWFGFQAIINMGAITGLFPLTGIPLPLISLGGSSLVLTLVGMGILLNISKYTIDDGKDKDSFSRWWNSWTRSAALFGRRKAR